MSDTLEVVFDLVAFRFAYPAAFDAFWLDLWGFPRPKTFVRGMAGRYLGNAGGTRTTSDQVEVKLQPSQIFARAALPAPTTWQPQREN